MQYCMLIQTLMDEIWQVKTPEKETFRCYQTVRVPMYRMKSKILQLESFQSNTKVFSKDGDLDGRNSVSRLE